MWLRPPGQGDWKHGQEIRAENRATTLQHTHSSSLTISHYMYFVEEAGLKPTEKILYLKEVFIHFISRAWENHATMGTDSRTYCGEDQGQGEKISKTQKGYPHWAKRRLFWATACMSPPDLLWGTAVSSYYIPSSDLPHWEYSHFNTYNTI